MNLMFFSLALLIIYFLLWCNTSHYNLDTFQTFTLDNIRTFNNEIIP